MQRDGTADRANSAIRIRPCRMNFSQQEAGMPPCIFRGSLLLTVDLHGAPLERSHHHFPTCTDQAMEAIQFFQKCTLDLEFPTSLTGDRIQYVTL